MLTKNVFDDSLIMHEYLILYVHEKQNVYTIVILIFSYYSLLWNLEIYFSDLLQKNFVIVVMMSSP
jgi:hypothetical protein